MRAVRFVGVSADGRALVVEVDGEHRRLPLDAALRAAVTAPDQPALALASPVSPREIQRRIRAGETAAEIAAASGVAVERVARFERPVLEERRHQAERARAALVNGRPLDDLANEHAQRHESGASLSWDARLAEDGTWRLVLLFSTGVAACWSYVPASRLLAPMERVARSISNPASAEEPGDVLQAVLRPLGSPVRERAPSVPEAPSRRLPADEVDSAEEGEPADGTAVAPNTPVGGREDTGQGGAGQDAGGSERRAERGRRLRGRRSEVPSWDDITAATVRQSPPPR